MGEFLQRHDVAGAFKETGAQAAVSMNRAKSGKQASISAHPAFPAVVALWFAALLGLGCLVVPVIIFETISSASGIASLFPAAAPPLGPTARIAIALLAALGGAGIGLLLARKVAAASGTVQAARKRAPGIAEPNIAGSPKRPISAREELGSLSLDESIAATESHDTDDGSGASAAVRFAPAPLPGRRRALSVTNENERSEYLDHAPLPGGHPVFDEAVSDPAEVDPAAGADELDLGGFSQDSCNDEQLEEAVEAACGDGAEAFGRGASVQRIPEELRGDIAANDRPGAPGYGRAASGGQVFEAHAVEASATAAARAEPRSLESLSEELSAMTMTYRPQGEATYNPLANLAAADRIAPEAAPARSPFAPSPAPVSAMGHNSGLNELAMVDLIDRFARALQKSGTSSAPPQLQEAAAWSAPAAMPSPAFPPASPAFAAPRVEEPQAVYAPAPAFAAPQPFVAHSSAPQAPAAAEPMVFRRQTSAAQEQPQFAAPQPGGAGPDRPEPSLAQMPQALRPLAFHDDHGDDDESEPLDLSFPFARPAPPQPADVAAGAAETGADDEDHGDSGAYSSLLSMKGRFGTQQAFVRIDDDEPATVSHPVVVFPGQDNRRAEPAVDGPSRDPLGAAQMPPPVVRPFDSPVQAPLAGATPAEPANAGETERALREALEKLQRMSGAG